MNRGIQKSAITLIFALAISGGFFVFPKNIGLAASGINKQINFQGKVVNTDGTNVADGNYNFVFSIYSQQAPGGSAIWTESKTLTVTDGMFQTNLGDSASLPGSVDFNTDNIYLGINFNSNGEMTPRVQFTASPYAFNSDNLDGKDWTNPGTIGSSANTLGLSSGGTSSWTNTSGGLTISTATSGTLALSSAGALNFSGSAASYFNTSSGNISFQIAGTGTTGTLQVGAGGAGSASPDYFGLDVKSTTGDPTGGFEGAMYYNTYDNKFRCYQGSAWTDCIGSGPGGMAIGGSITSATQGSILFAGASGVLAQDNANFFWDNTNNYLGIGTATPSRSLEIVGADSDIFAYSYSNTSASEYKGFRANGSLVSPAVVTANTILARFHSAGYSAAAAGFIDAGKIEFTADGEWDTAGDTSDAPTRISLFTVPNGSATAQERVRIDNQGNVGIGTAAPAASLDIRGTLNSGDSANYFSVDSDGDFTGIGTADYLVSGNRYAFRYSADEDYGMYFNSAGYIDFLGDGQALMQRFDVTSGNIYSSGRIGINTTTPDVRMESLDNSNPQLRLSYTDGVAFTDFQTTSTGNLFINPTGGNVGIGTDAPGEKLTISDGSLLAYTSTGAYGPKLTLTHNAVDGGHSYDIISAGSGNVIGAGKFGIYDNTTNDARFVIDTAGNVGIGTTSPGTQLQVNGTLRVFNGSDSDMDIFGSYYGGVFKRSGMALGLYVGTGMNGGYSEVIGSTMNDGGSFSNVLDDGNARLGILEGGASPTFHTTFQGGNQVGDIAYTLPIAQAGGSGYVLSNDGSGVLSWAAAGSGSGTLQTAYNATSGNSILTTTGRNIAFILGEVATPTMFSVENQDTSGTSAEYIKNSIASGTLIDGLRFEQTGAGTMTNAISILETAGTIGTAINIGSGVGTGIKFADTTNTIDMNNAANSALSIINSGTGVASVSLENGGSYTGAGAVTFSSAAGAGLTINSGTTGTLAIGDDSSAETINIGTGAAAKALVIGSTNTTSSTIIKSGTGNIKLQGTGGTISAPNVVQIGVGGAGSTTPNVLSLDTKTLTGDPAPAGTPNGSMYYNIGDGKFRCLENGTWVNCIGSSTGGTPGGSVNQIQYNNGSGGFGADAGLTFDSSSQTLGISGANAEINMTGVTTDPAASAAGTLTTYAKSIGGRMMPKWIGPSGLDTPIQPFIGMNHVASWSSGGSTTVTALGYATPSATGTATALATNTTNLYGSMSKVAYRVTTASTTAVAGVRGATAQWFLSNQTGVGGFFFVMRGGPDTGVSTTTSRFFMGMTAGTNAPTDVEPSSIANQIGLGYDSADASLQIIARNGSTLTKINLNTVTSSTNWNVPTVNNTDMYELVLFAPPNTTTISYRVTNLITGAQYSGSTSAGPAVNTLLAPRIWSSVGGTSSVIGVALVSMYLESDY